MSDIKWIKLSTEMFSDEKIQLIENMPESDTIIVIWMKLLVQAGKTNASGYIYLSENIPYTDEMLATIFGRPVNTVRFALETFKKFNMISVDDDNFISINNWEKYQNIEGMERIREQTRKRVAEYRKRKKNDERNDGKEDVTLHVTSRNAPEEELELEEEEDKDKEIKDIRPTLEKNTSKDATFPDAKKKRTRRKRQNIYDESHLGLAKLLYKKIKENNPDTQKPSIESWANTFRLMMERDNRGGKEIQDIILWCQSDSFWYKNILSADKLRKQYDRLLLGMKDDNEHEGQLSPQEKKRRIDKRMRQKESKRQSKKAGDDVANAPRDKDGNIDWSLYEPSDEEIGF